MAEAFLTVLLKKLSSLIQREIGLMMGADKEMKKLSSTLTTIKKVLEDAERKQFQSEAICDWLSKLNDIANEIEDILDDCAAEVAKLERKGRGFAWKKVPFSWKMGRRMKEMAESLDAVAKERENFHLREIDALQPREVDARRKTGHVLNDRDNVHGRDQDRDMIVDVLVNEVADCHQLSVLPIVGVGGLGKTTLAQLVYDDPRVTEHFDIKIWVFVSDNFDLQILLEAMIEFATKSAPNLKHLPALQDRLQQVLDQKRYLLILDDVWNENEEEWVKLKSSLAWGSKGSSVVVTTRSPRVAEIMGTLSAHSLKPLSDEHCWQLFRLRAFGQGNEGNPNLETIGRQIVKKCAGVPLAAKALGGLLRFKREEKDWILVRESEIWNLPEVETSILPALRLSYHHLPSALRRCFVYCAVFPKDSRIKKQDLIFRWMAHGCISSNQMQDVEDVGDQIWNELVLRSLFQEVETIGRETTCKMHDLIHDLAQSIMENKIVRAQTKRSGISTAANSKIREVHFNRHSMTSSSSITLQVSTLTTITNYSCLRILKLVGAGVEKLPSAIGKLNRLRYLDLTASSIRTLPRTFCDLWHLQILILSNCCYLKGLPKRIRCMTNLRHIFLEGCISLSHMPSSIGKLAFLKTLSLYVLGHKAGNQLDELESLNLGGNLEIKHLERVQNHMNATKANLVGKPDLRHLVLHWKGDSTSGMAAKLMDDEKVLEALEPHANLETLRIDGFRGSYFPLWMKKMENVTKLTIANCPNFSHLRPLGDLPHLEFLDLTNLASLEYINVEEDEIRGQNSVGAKFPSLELLRLQCLPNLKGLLKEEEVRGEISMFPNLQGLHIEDCESLILPPLSTLKRLVATNFSTLNLSSFSKLENLFHLELYFDENNTIARIPEDAMEGLHNLKRLVVWDARDQHRLPEKWFRDLKSVQESEICYCNIGSCFPGGWLRHLCHLKCLTILGCSGLVELPEEIECLPLLEDLQLSHLDDMVSLPQVLQHIPPLKYLLLLRLPQLTSLPDWFGNLTSLVSLGIYSCPGIPSLPSSIQGLNLEHLTIMDCPQLKKRCEKENGEDWHKIAHIPQLRIW